MITPEIKAIFITLSYPHIPLLKKIYDNFSSTTCKIKPTRVELPMNIHNPPQPPMITWVMNSQMEHKYFIASRPTKMAGNIGSW